MLHPWESGERNEGRKATYAGREGENTLPKTTRHITPATASNAAGARGLPGDEETKAKS